MSASFYEAHCDDLAGVGTSRDQEDSFYNDTPKEPAAPSSYVADPEGVLDSVRSSSDWEAVTTPDTTLMGMLREVLVARDGAWGHVFGVAFIVRRPNHQQAGKGRLTWNVLESRLSLSWVTCVPLRRGY